VYRLPAESIAKPEGLTCDTTNDALFVLAGTARICAVSAMSKFPAASVTVADGLTAVEETVVVTPLCKL
jgi:hypothetical protein